LRKTIFIAIFSILILLPALTVVLSTLSECYKAETGQTSAKVTPSDTNPAVTDDIKKIEAEVNNYHRAEENTYLTLPEWYIVYSAEEYADFLKNKLPSNFPYFSSVGQYWCNYNHMYQITKDRYAFNTGYHFSLLVIGSSFTVEYLIKGFYENTVGRISELLGFYDLSEEDVYASLVAKEYADSLYQTPWYEFPFGSKLAGLWKETSFWGTNFLRKWERKLFLSLEYGVKAIYGAIIKKGSHSAYGVEISETLALVENIPDFILKDEPTVRVVKPVDPQLSLVSFPRYELFTKIVPGLMKRGLRFVDIAGNNEILVTAIAPRDWAPDLEDGQFIYAMNILTNPNIKRVALRVPVGSLHETLDNLEAEGVKMEHIYDY
jgi:hypothetical protein